MGFAERMLRLFLELHAFELRERGSSSGAVVDRTSYTKHHGNCCKTVGPPNISLSLSIFVSICIYIYISQPWMIDDDWAEATDCFMG